MSVGHAMKPMSEAHFAILRRHMVEVIGIQVDLASEELGKAALDERVLAAMRNVPRHRFVPSFLAPLAYQDTPLPIGFDKTISQPFIVALMTDLLGPEPHESTRSGVERRNRGGVGRPSRSEPAPARLLRCRHPHRRRVAWLARARALAVTAGPEREPS